MNQKIKNRIGLNVLAILAGFFLSVQISSASDISRESVISLVNASRAGEGLSVLAENSKLNQAAMEKARDMIQNNYFAHTSPQEVTPWHWFEKNGYDYSYAGENLAINFQSAEEEHEAWMESQKHKKNILNPKFQEIGVGVEEASIDNKPTIVTVQLFGAREDFGVVMGEFSQGLQEPAPSGAVAAVSEKEIISKYSGNQLINFDREWWIGAFQAYAIIILSMIMVVNSFIVVRLFSKESANLSRPVKIILAK